MSRNRRRGKRYDETPKLNVKRVIATIITLGVIAGIAVSVKSMFNTEPLTQEVSTQVTYFQAYSNGKWGVIDNTGNTIVSMSNDEMVIIPDKNKDLFICTYNIDYNTEKFNTKVVNKNGEKILQEFENVQAIENTNGNEIWYEKDILKFENLDKYGLIDFSGKIILDAEYDEIYAMDGIEKNIIIVKDGKKGLVNSSVGDLVIPAEYDEISTLTIGSYKDGYIVKKNDKYGVILSDSKKVFECKYDEIQNVATDGYYVVKENGKNKIINANEDKILDVDFEKVSEINGNKIVVATSGKYGIIDLSDENAKLKNEYDELKYIYDKYYIACKDGLYGVISANGDVIIDFKYSSMDYVKSADFIEADNSDFTTDVFNRRFETVFSSVIISEINIEKGYLKIRQNEEYKYYNFTFEEKTPQEALISNTLFLVCENGKYGFNNKNGERIVDCIYDEATEQNAYGYCAIKNGALWGAIKSDGTVVLEPTVNLDEKLYVDFISVWHFDSDLGAYTK